MMIRTFVSVDVPVSDSIKDLLSELKGIRNVKVSPENQMHITLKFLGDTDEKKVMRLCSSLRDALKDTKDFDITIEGVGTFPNIRNPRVIWLGVKDPKGLIDAADIIDSCVKGLNLNCDDKRFSPHMTVGRVNGPTDIKDLLDNDKKKVFCSFRCDHIDIMKSVLTPKGAIHSVVDRIDLC